MINLKKQITSISFGLICVTTNTMAQNAVIPYTFSAGQEAVAEEVNENFQELETAVNSKVDNVQFQELETIVNDKQSLVASMGYQKTPTVRGVTISNVTINGGSIVSPVSPGSSIKVSLDYHIVDTGCPGCIDEIQIGFSQLTPAGCVYTGVPGTRGVSGSGNITLTAPAEPGLYYVGVDRAQDFSCPSHWWNGEPKSFDRYIAVITVQ